MVFEWDTLFISGVVVGAFLAHYSSQQEQLPGPKGHWLKGNLDLLKTAKQNQNAYQLYTQLGKQYGPIYQVTVPGQRVVVICDPKTIQTVLNDIDTFWPSPRLVDSFGTIAAGSLITLGGSLWKEHKKLLVKTFFPDQLRYACEIENKLVDDMIENWNIEKPIDVHEQFSKLIWDTLGLVAFSTKFENGDKVMDDFAYVVAGLDKRLPLPKYLWNWILSDQEEFGRRCESLRNVARELITKRKQQNADVSERDLLQRILEEKTEHGESLTEEQVINEMMLFFIAGYETTSNCLCWVVYRLAQNPNVVEKLRQEIEQVCGDEKTTITYDMLPSFKYLEYIIKETLRMYPTVPLIGRYCTQDSVFLGHHISKGTNLVLSLHAAHHDPKLFSDPYTFNPDRWNSQQPSQYFFPFGGGPKTCIGNKLAWVELKVATIKLFQRFDFTLTTNEEILPVHTLTLGPKNKMFVDVKVRN